MIENLYYGYIFSPLCGVIFVRARDVLSFFNFMHETNRPSAELMDPATFEYETLLSLTCLYMQTLRVATCRSSSGLLTCNFNTSISNINCGVYISIKYNTTLRTYPTPFIKGQFFSYITTITAFS